MAVVALASCRTLEPPALPPVTLPLPQAPDGTGLLMQLDRARLELDPTLRDPITAVGACADLVSYCVGPDSIDTCVARAPACATSQPWNEARPCCPSACADAYRQARRAGQSELDAFQDVFFRQPDCFPGVRAALEAG